MSPRFFARKLVLSLAVLLGAWGVSSFALADIKNYEFRIVDKKVKAGAAVLTVRLVHKPDGKLAPDAVIFAKRLDMAPAGMETMTTAIEPMPSTEPGVYRFKADLSMEGSWRMSLAAKVQGETGTVENRITFEAAP